MYGERKQSNKLPKVCNMASKWPVSAGAQWEGGKGKRQLVDISVGRLRLKATI